MEKINWEQISISFQYRSGQITDKRIQKITEELKRAEIEVSASMRRDTGVVVFMLDKGCAFIITQESLSYNFPMIADRFSDVKKHLTAIMDIMSVEDRNAFVINAQGTTPGCDSHRETKEGFNSKHENVLNDYADIYGVGYRFLIKNQQYSGEFKIEPMLADNKKYYYQYLINTYNNFTLDDLCRLMESCLENDFEALRRVL